MCYNCNPVPRPKCHTVKAVIDKGVPYCIDCGKDVTRELDAERISELKCNCESPQWLVGECINCGGLPHAT